MHGWTKPSEDDLRSLLAVPFGLTRSLRDPRQLRRARTCVLDERRMWRFDVALNVKLYADGEDVSNNYSAGVATLGFRIDGRIAIERRGLLRRPESAGLSEVAAPDAALGARFRVRAGSPELAAAVLRDEVRAWLSEHGTGFHYEIVHDRVLAYGWRRYLGGSGPVRAALGLARVLDRAHVAVKAPPSSVALHQR
jgi:hypothetical protein